MTKDAYLEGREHIPSGCAISSIFSRSGKAVSGEKITFLAVCGKEAVQKGVKAGDIIKSVTAICGGKGGGKPDSAMGGGSNILKLDDALASVDDFVAAKLGL